MQYWYGIHAALALGKTIASAPLCCSKGFFYKSYNYNLHSFFDVSTMSLTMLPVKIADFVGDPTSSLPPTQLHVYIFAPDVALRPVMSSWIRVIVGHLCFSHLPGGTPGSVLPRPAREQQVAVTLARVWVVGYGRLLPGCHKKSWRCPPRMAGASEWCSLCSLFLLQGLIKSLLKGRYLDWSQKNSWAGLEVFLSLIG